MSDEPISLDEAAVMLNELYESYVRAGFTEVQALDLVKELVSGARTEE